MDRLGLVGPGESEIGPSWHPLLVVELFDALSMFGIALLAGVALLVVKVASIDSALVATLGLLWATGTLAIAAVTLPPWLVGPARVRYLVADGKLRVMRGRKELRTWRCDEVLSVKVHGAFTRRSLFSGRTPESFPNLVVWSDDRYECPSVLRWGLDDARRVEESLRLAIEFHRSR